jgi:ATP-dependent exoDNAse (exonuclease V) beta subunit
MSTHAHWKSARHYEEASWMRMVSASARRHAANDLIARRIKTQYEGEQDQLPKQLQDLLDELDQKELADIVQKPSTWR